MHATRTRPGLRRRPATPGRRGSRSHVRRPLVAVVFSAVVGALVTLAPLGLTTSPVAAAPGAVDAAPAATGGCRSVGGIASVTGGPQRATVVVDPGSGPVWSACISFRGTISGLDALELAAGTIPGLDPEYEPYPGQGRAVCRLLGAGNDPPDCLGKSVEYWAYFRDGTYARGGAGSSTVADGAVEGWRFGRGTAPRAATHGTEAVPASAVPTTAPPPTTVPPPTTDPAAGAVPDPGGGPSVSSAPSTTTSTPTPDTGSGSVPTTTGPAAGAGAGSPSGEASTSAPTTAPGSGDDDGLGTGGPVTVTERSDDGSSVGSIVGFGSALGALGVAAVVVRRRRTAAAPTGHLDDTST